MIALGGGLGAVSRYLVGGWVQALAGGPFPVGTLVVNVTGCFLIGLLSQLAESAGAFTPATRALLFTGFLGGYTTFSTFANEAFSMGRDGVTPAAVAYVVLSVGLGLAAVGLGRLVVQSVWG